MPLLREALEIGRIDDLGMLDPPAAVALVGERELLDRIEQLRVGGVADRVDRDLEAVHRGAAHQVAQGRVGQEVEPVLAGRVLVVLP